MKSSRISAASQTLTQRFVRDEKGATMMTFGLSMIPIVLAVQIGIEYSRMSRAQTALGYAADNAALTAAKVGMQLKTAGNSNRQRNRRSGNKTNSRATQSRERHCAHPEFIAVRTGPLCRSAVAFDG